MNASTLGVLLVVRLCGIKRRNRRNFGYDRLMLCGLCASKLRRCGIHLCRAKREYCASVLVAHVGTLAIFGRRVMHLKENIDKYFKREVLPHVPHAWVDMDKHKVGYEINFNREFYEYKPLRRLGEIRKDIARLENKTHNTVAKAIEA